jgi:DNA polymerase-1
MAGILDHVSLHLVETIEDLFAFFRWVGERRETPLGIDTESEGLNPHKHKLRLVQFGDLHQGWAIPWDLWKGGILQIIRDYEGEWVCHNAPFEQRMFSVQGGVQLPWDRLHDTMIQAAVEDTMQPKGLKILSERRVDRTAAQGQKALDDGMKAQGWTWATVPFSFEPYWVYGALDPVLTVHLDQKIRPGVEATALEAYSLEMAALRVCTNMMLKGMKLDVPYVHKARSRMEKFSSEAKAWLKSAHGITSAMSNGQLARAFEGFGCELTEFTAGGAPQMNKDVLENFKNFAADPNARQLAEYVLAIRHAEKIIGSYYDNFLEFRDSEDIVHATINTMAARTTRMSVTDPALQTLHRDDKVVRGSFIPREGNAFISCDLDQVEARMSAHFTEDPGLIEAFERADQEGGDFFCELSELVFGERIAKKDQRRNLIKTLTYRSAYGGGDNIDAMAHATGVSHEQMAHAAEEFFNRFPGIKDALSQHEQEAKAHRLPHIYSPLGHHLGIQRGSEYTQAFNARIQGTAAIYMKQRLVIMDAAGLGDNMVLPVHDEILCEVPKEDAEEAAKLIEECMTDRTTYRVPLTAGASIMLDRWQKV